MSNFKFIQILRNVLLIRIVFYCAIVINHNCKLAKYKNEIFLEFFFLFILITVIKILNILYFYFYERRMKLHSRKII